MVHTVRQSSEFVARMEDVLELYGQEYDEAVPVVCMGEQPVQLLEHTRPPEPMMPGREPREDYEYERRGTCSVFMLTEPLAGRRHVDVSERRTKNDWAHRIKELLDVHYHDTECV